VSGVDPPSETRAGSWAHTDSLSLIAADRSVVTDLAPDAIYRCRECGERFVDDQLAFERHAAREHDRVRDVLPTILDGI